jgi:class 3 adenylate cyclase
VYGQLLRDGVLRPKQAPETVETDGTQYVVQVEEIPVAPGSDRAVVVIGGNLSTRLGILGVLNRTLLTVTGFAALLAVVLLGLGMGYWVNRPVEQLAAGMKRIREGDLSRPVEIKARDEMGQLAESYNQMLVELQKKEQYMRMVSKSAVAAVETQVSADLAGSGERRVVTVLFSDIRGFTTLCEGIDPAKLVQLLNRYFDAMVEIIYRHGGLLDKFIGDAIMAIFEGDGHPANAVRAAVEMITECKRLDRDEELGIKIGVGLHTGEVVAGFVGAKEFMNHTYLGDAVNVAARLEGVSKNGKHTKVILSQATLDEIPGVAEVERLDIEKVKGKTEAVYMYEVVRLVRGRELVAGMDDPDPEKRARAAELVARLGGREAIPQLLSLVEDEDDSVVVAALGAIGALARSEALDEALVGRIRELTEGRSERVRSSLVTTLGCLAGVETLGMLQEYLEDPVPRVRANAIEAMATLRSVTARRKIGPLLDDPNHRVKANAAITLFALDPDAVAAKLVDGIHDESALERASCCYATCVVAERHPENIRRGSAGSDLDARSYRLHAAFRRIAGALAVQLPREDDEMVLRNMVPAIHVLFGTETARQMVEDAFDDDGQDRLRESGVLKVSMELPRMPTKPGLDD